MGIILKDAVCANCGQMLKLYLDTKVYKCNKRTCKVKMSIFTKSIFARMRVSLEMALSIIYEWTLQTPVTIVARTCSLSPSTVSIWYQQIGKLPWIETIHRRFSLNTS